MSFFFFFFFRFLFREKKKKKRTLSGRIAPPFFFRNRSLARITESSMHSKNSA